VDADDHQPSVASASGRQQTATDKPGGSYWLVSGERGQECLFAAPRIGSYEVRAGIEGVGLGLGPRTFSVTPGLVSVS